MLSILSPSLISVNLGPSETAVGRIGTTQPIVESAEISELSVPWHDLAPNPSIFSLLSWHTKISYFSGRDAEMEPLYEWAFSPQAVLVKFVTGDGGVGKSRLAAEFANNLRSRGWSAGFVDLRKATAFRLENEGTLLVVDYPEESVEEVKELLRDLAMLPSVSRFRVLFLTRQDIQRWNDTILDANASDLIDMVPIQLERLDATSEHDLYHSALERASEALGTTPPPLSRDALADWVGRDPENNRPLFILAAAVHSAINPEDEVVRFTGRRVMDALVEREIGRLRRIADGMGARDPLVLARIVAMSAIADEITPQRVVESAADCELDFGFTSDKSIDTALEDGGLLSDGAVKAPRPDLPAAAFAVSVLSAKPHTAPELIWAALDTDVRGGVTRLSRLCHDAEVVLGLHEHRMSEWLGTAVSGNIERCETLRTTVSETNLPLGLVDTAIAIWKTLLRQDPTDEERALLLNNLSVDLAGAGDTAAALETIWEAVEIKRRLAKANPALYEPDLAIGLNNLSADLADAGDNAAALETSQEAVEIQRRLAESNPALYEPDLAMSLNNLSANLANAGDNAAALETSQEAVEIKRRLAEANPALYEPDLAKSLNNLSADLADAGDNAAALETSQEAVEIQRRLAEANPARYEPDLAMRLNNLSTQLSNAGDNAAALETSQEAVEIRRRFAKANPARYEPDLATSLNNLSNRLSNAGDNAAALETNQEAVELLRRLAKANLARYEPDLAVSLNNLSIRLSSAGDNAAALKTVQESVEIQRRLAEANPARYEPELAMSLNNLSADLADAGDNAAALETSQEAVEIRRRLAEANPARYEPDLAISLNNLSAYLADAGDNAAALETSQGAVEIQRRLAEANPARYEPDLATSLNNLSKQLSSVGDNTAALETIQESVERQRRLAEANPARYEPNLAISLNNLSILLSDTGDSEGAHRTLREAQEIRQRL